MRALAIASLMEIRYRASVHISTRKPAGTFWSRGSCRDVYAGSVSYLHKRSYGQGPHQNPVPARKDRLKFLVYRTACFFAYLYLQSLKQFCPYSAGSTTSSRVRSRYFPDAWNRSGSEQISFLPAYDQSGRDRILSNTSASWWIFSSFPITQILEWSITLWSKGASFLISSTVQLTISSLTFLRFSTELPFK